MTPPNEVVWAGIDTHTDTHTIALLDERGRPLGAETFTADPDGYDRLIGMLPGPGRVAAVGVEGTNSFGAALARRLTAAGYEVREVLRPRRSVRRRDGKSDPLDAVAAARSVMAGDGTSLPKSSDGWVEALRHLNAQRSQLVSAMTAISNSTNGLLVTAPEPIRERLCFVKLGSAFCAVFFRSVGSGFSAGCAVSAAACLRCVVVVLLVYLVMRACSLL